jgi:hypothetical protein
MTIGTIEYVQRVETDLAGLLCEEGDLRENYVCPTKIPLRCGKTGLETGRAAQLDLEAILRMPFSCDLLVDDGYEQSELNISTEVDVAYDEHGFASKTKVVVRGMIVGPNGLPTGFELEKLDDLYVNLSIGACPVNRDGELMEKLPKWCDDLSSYPPSREGGMSLNSNAERSLSSGSSGQSSNSKKPAGTFARVRAMSQSPKAERERKMSKSSSSSFGGGITKDQRAVSDFDQSLRLDSSDACDWSKCRVTKEVKKWEKANPQRTRSSEIYIVVDGEPVAWVFSRSNNVLKLLRVEYTLELSPDDSGIELPIHLLGEIGRSEDGCAVLREHGVVKHLAEVLESSEEYLDRMDDEIDDYEEERKGIEVVVVESKAAKKEKVASAKKEEAESTTKEKDEKLSKQTMKKIGNRGEQLRGAIWALASICKSESGFALVKSSEDIDFVYWVCSQAMDSTDMNIRGTCFQVMGLINTTQEGKKKLFDAGWDSVGLGGAVVPNNMSKFFSWHNNNNAEAERERRLSRLTRKVGADCFARPELDDQFNSNTESGRSYLAGRKTEPFISHEALYSCAPASFATSNEMENMQKSLNEKEKKIVELVGKLLDKITQKEAMATLSEMIKESSNSTIGKERFIDNPKLVRVIWEMLGNYSFELNVRRTIMKAFKLSVLLGES